jgi:hypothetical protein
MCGRIIQSGGSLRFGFVEGMVRPRRYPISLERRGKKPLAGDLRGSGVVVGDL